MGNIRNIGMAPRNIKGVSTAVYISWRGAPWWVRREGEGIDTW